MAKQSKHPSGVEDGTVLTTTVHGQPGEPVKIVNEVVVHEEDGTWHKEAGA